MASVKKLIFQRAKIDDIKEVRAMIQELADFEKMSDGPKLTEEELSRDSGLTGEEERIHTYILKLKQDNQTELTPIGMAICYFTYSTWEGRAYFLEDFYVRPEYRGIGGGKRIFQEVAAKAKEFGCKRLDFHVLKWNPARKFYAAMGAVDVTDTDEWHYYRLFETQIDELSRKLQLEEENRK